MALVQVDADLGDEGVGERGLCQGQARDSKLADADQTNAELGNRDETAGKLANGYNALGRDRDPVGSVLEGDVEHRQPQEGGLGLVLKASAIPALFGGERGPANRTGRGLFRDLVFTFSTRLHSVLVPRAAADTCSGPAGRTFEVLKVPH